MSNKVKEKYIFVATTGRSGTEYLSKIFNTVPGAISLHEPEPVLYNGCPSGYNKNKYFEERFNRLKLPTIEKASIGYKYYIETNHQFIKRFITLAYGVFGKRLSIVHLIRDPVDTALSFFIRDSIPGKTKAAMLYLLNPGEKNNIIQVSDLLKNGEFNHDFYKCLWYWYEIEARIKYYKKKYSELKWYTIILSELNRLGNMIHMLSYFGLEANKEELIKIRGKRFNKGSTVEKRKVNREIFISYNNKFKEILKELKYDTY